MNLVKRIESNEKTPLAYILDCLYEIDERIMNLPPPKEEIVVKENPVHIKSENESSNVDEEYDGSSRNHQ